MDVDVVVALVGGLLLLFGPLDPAWFAGRSVRSLVRHSFARGGEKAPWSPPPDSRRRSLPTMRGFLSTFALPARPGIGPDMAVGMRVGYACVNTQLQSPARTTRLANATPERLLQLTLANLDALEAILRWNAAHGMLVFRLTSNLVPLASHPVNTLRWWDDLADRFAELGALMAAEGMRLSTHPGQYTVLASASPDVVAAAVRELDYHGRLLDAFGLDHSHRIVLHVGPVASGADGIRERFAAGFGRLSPAAAERVVLENDERWPLAEVLPLAERLAAPVVLDAFHHRLAPSFEELSLREVTLLAAATWRPGDGRQEVHFATQEPAKRPGAHAETLDDQAFLAFAGEVGDLPIDCIVEVKDKERSVLRAQALLRG